VNCGRSLGHRRLQHRARITHVISDRGIRSADAWIPADPAALGLVIQAPRMLWVNLAPVFILHECLHHGEQDKATYGGLRSRQVALFVS
jgi:hypothetical protein